MFAFIAPAQCHLFVWRSDLIKESAHDATIFRRRCEFMLRFLYREKSCKRAALHHLLELAQPCQICAEKCLVWLGIRVHSDQMSEKMRMSTCSKQTRRGQGGSPAVAACTRA